jgi:phosphatidylethanolamine/phosphatidyl-N-methylethanolamine N-methyltransferase
MKVNTNNWNKIRYTLYSPGYDLAARLLSKSRKKSIESLEIKPNNKILIVGAGTGLDLEFLPSNCEIYATDITPTMIKRLINRNLKLKRNLHAEVMDGQKLNFTNESFDIVILHLILAVIPDPIACILEVERVLKKGGQIVIYDKLVPENRKVSRRRRFFNIFTNLFFSDITRDFKSIIEKTNLKIISDIDADFNGNFRIIKLMKSMTLDKK